MQSEAHAAVARGSLDAAYAARLPPQPKRDLPDTSPSSERTVSMFSRLAACLRCKLQPCTASHASIADLCTYFIARSRPPTRLPNTLLQAKQIRSTPPQRADDAVGWPTLRSPPRDKYSDRCVCHASTRHQPYSDILVRPFGSGPANRGRPTTPASLPLSSHSPQGRTHVDGRHM
jgi:hypothetical protein